jgi:hypothetical protein
LWKFNKVYNVQRQISDHQKPVKYQISLPKEHLVKLDPAMLYIHHQEHQEVARAGD